MTGPPYTLLIVEGSLEVSAEIHGSLDAVYTCITTATAAEARVVCRRHVPDLVVVDERLPDGDGLALLDELTRTYGESAFAGIVLLKHDDPALVERALTLGAHDYVLKGPDITRYLGRAVVSALAQLVLRRENAVLRRELDSQREHRVLLPSPTFNQAVLDSLASHVAVLDDNGWILAVNTAWRRFARQEGLASEEALSRVDVGTNYLAVCQASAAAGDAEAAVAYAGIRAVLDSRQSDFSLEYPCHNPQKQRWFLMQVTPLAAGPGRAVVTHTDVTARKQAEQMLQQREAQLAGIIDSAMDAIITLDSDQRIVGWNAAAERMFGSPAAEALGRLHARFLPERYRNNHHTLVESFGATGDTARTMGHQRSLTALRADGTEFPIEASISRKAVNGQILYTAIIRDITERESVAEASRANAARQSFLLRLNDLLLPLADPVAIQLVAVQALGEHLRLSRAGYAEDQGDGETLRLTRNYAAGVPGIEGIYRYDDYSPGVLQEFRAGRTVVRSDIAADPTLTDAEWQAHAMLQLGATVNVPLVRGGHVRAVLFAHQREARAWTPDEVMLIESVAARTWDAVERARAEAALHENLQKYRTLFESIDEGVCLVERLPLRPDGLRDYRYIAMNPAMQAMFGIPDLSGQSIRDNFPDQSEAWYDDYDRVLETGQSMRFERESVPQGLVLEMFVTRLEEGSGQRLLAVMQDVTKRRRAEQELAAGRQQLLDLSGRLVNTQEDERRALAYELHDEIGQQLTALNIALELEARATAAQLRTRMHEAQAIVADLTSQVRRLSLDLRPPMLDDLGLLPTLRWHIERFMQQTGVVVDFKYSGLDGALSPHIAIAAYRIIQEALTNIARHAQATTVQVGIWSSAKQLKITIEDQGRGFDPAIKPPHGRSLGVASMRERAELLGGQFSLDAAPGEGTHIRVSLPLDAADA